MQEEEVLVALERRNWLYHRLFLQLSLQTALSLDLVDLSPVRLVPYPERPRENEGGWSAIPGYYFSRLPEQLQLRMVMAWSKHGYVLCGKSISEQWASSSRVP